jgi:hypothetical protein
VRLDVFDVRGRHVTDQDLGMMGGGTHRVGWDGRASSGRDAGAGIFWIRVRVDERALVKRVVKQG